jgi:phospholipid transport system substrate-binding protein
VSHPLTYRRAFLYAAGAAATLVTLPAWAADPAAQLILDISAEVVELMKTKTGIERQNGFQRILETKFDLPYMGQMALGKYWDGTTPEQRVRFLKATATAEARAYNERFGQYGGQSVTVNKVSPRANGVFEVDSQINQPNGGEPVKLRWEVQNRGSGLRVTDVKVEGVSMVMTRRSDFSAYIQRNGGNAEALIQELEARARR